MRNEKGQFVKGFSANPTTQFKKGIVPFNKGKKGLQVAWNKGKVGVQVSTRKGTKQKPHTKETKNKISQALIKDYKETGRISFWKGKRGADAPYWKGGITPINIMIRTSLEYDEWRTKVFERDLYTCQDCFEVGGYLHADHIKSFALFPELRLEVSNGRTLCVPCHYKITFGKEMPENTNKWGHNLYKRRELN